MKTKLIPLFVSVFLTMILGSSCATRNYVADKGHYAIYTQKLGVNLKGSEDIELLKAMANWKGVPYKYGGNTKSGTDCSGFVSSLYKEVYGKQLHRSSKDMVKDVRFIPKKDLQAGDLLFFKINSNKITHVGIYIADNKFIHATTRNGVMVNDLDQKYYAESYYKSGRVRM